MDPLTIMLFCLAVLYLIKRGTEDVVSIATGNESPRVARLRDRRAENRFTVAEALGVRIARLIAEGRDSSRPRGPMRTYASELWADSWEDARAWHARRRAKRGRPVHGQPVPPAEPLAGDDPEILDAEVIDPDDDWEWLGEHQSKPPLTDPPGPDSAQEPHRKEPSLMPQNNTGASTVVVDGNALSPRELLAYGEGCKVTNQGIAAQLESMIAAMRAAKLSPGSIALVGRVIAAGEGFATGAGGAIAEYVQHVRIQAELAGDHALRDAAIGYLDSATV